MRRRLLPPRDTLRNRKLPKRRLIDTPLKSRSVKPRSRLPPREKPMSKRSPRRNLPPPPIFVPKESSRPSRNVKPRNKLPPPKDILRRESKRRPQSKLRKLLPPRDLPTELLSREKSLRPSMLLRRDMRRNLRLAELKKKPLDVPMRNRPLDLLREKRRTELRNARQ
jgi:hypothetical protein